MIKARSTASDWGRKKGRKKPFDFKDNFWIYSQFKTNGTVYKNSLDGDFAASLESTFAGLAHGHLMVSKTHCSTAWTNHLGRLLINCGDVCLLKLLCPTSWADSDWSTSWFLVLRMKRWCRYNKTNVFQRQKCWLNIYSGCQITKTISFMHLQSPFDITSSTEKLQENSRCRTAQVSATAELCKRWITLKEH